MGCSPQRPLVGPGSVASRSLAVAFRHGGAGGFGDRGGIGIYTSSLSPHEERVWGESWREENLKLEVVGCERAEPPRLRLR